MSIKKYLKDEILANNPDSHETVANAITGILQNIAAIEPEALSDFNIVCSIPSEIEGSPVFSIEVIEKQPVFTINPDHADLFTSNTISAIPIWSEETFNSESGEPHFKCEGLTIVALPSTQSVKTGAKMQKFINSIVQRSLLQAARKLSKLNIEGKIAEISSDPTSALLAATASSGSAETAFNKMYTLIRDKILSNARAEIEKCKSAGNYKRARQIASAFNTASLSKDILKACFSSQEAAEHYFPTLVNANEERGKRGVTWDNFLKLLINHAPKFKRSVIVKDENGDTIKETRADGKEYAKRTTVDDPQNPTIFAQMLEMRYNTVHEADEGESMVGFMADLDTGLEE